MAAEVSAIPADALAELERFWAGHPDLRQACVAKYGHDPVNKPLDYWAHGLAEPEHADVRASVEAAGGVLSLGDVKRWERQEIAEARVEKAAQVPAWAHYREAESQAVSCATCDFYDGTSSRCEMFKGQPHVEAGKVCDRWVSRIDKEGEPTGGTPQIASYPGGSRQNDVILGMAELIDALEPDQIAKADVKAAGIAVRAKDTGRVLMIQRSIADANDSAKGTWEFPGGKRGAGEHPYQTAKREWQEETGARLPRGEHVGEWRSGVYHGFVHEVPSEKSVKINLDHEDRRVLNPDDPDGDNIEVAAWWHPHQLKRMSALRPELRGSRPWVKVAKAGGGVLYLVSHAKTRYNTPGEPHNDRVQGWKNVPLDSTGRKQAKELGAMLKSASIDELHSSDLARAKQTADAISNATGVAVQASGDYRPWNLGSYAGHSSASVIPDLKGFMHDSPDKPVDGGESFNSFRDRFIPKLEKLIKEAESGKRVVLVTHSRNLELAEGWLKGRGHRSQVDTKAISEDKTDPATVVEIKPDKDGKWMPKQVADETGWNVEKRQTNAATVLLRVAGVSRLPSGHRVYRTETRDGRYVGRTGPTRVRARKGDVVKVQANDFLQDANGDLRWSNPNVVGSGYTDAPHSWRELAALAGGELAKDGAPGPAGDLPPAGDEGHAGLMTLSGPTLSSVHVPAPLPNISVAYANRRLIPDPERATFVVAKADRMKQLVYGVVLEPNSLDSQDDFMLPDAVEKTAHGYLKKAIKGKNRVHKLQHRGMVNVRGEKPSLCPVESFVAPVDFTYDGKEMIKKGSWVMVVHVEDPQLWQDFLDRKYNAFSVGGTGSRRKLAASPELVPHGYIAGLEANSYADALSARGLENFV